MAPTHPNAAGRTGEITMDTNSIDVVFERNEAVGGKLAALLATLDDETVSRLPAGEKWSIANVVEHVALVEANMIRICAKLLGKAESAGQLADGTISTSDSFKEKAMEIATLKLEAPDFVQPTLEAALVASMDRFEENRKALQELKAKFEEFDSNSYRFPHPFLGNLSAGEWLTLIGGHKLRHLKQIERLAAME